APRRDVAGRGRIVADDDDGVADVDVADVPGQLQHRQRAQLPGAVQPHGHSPLAPTCSRSSATIGGSTSRKPATSASLTPACSPSRTLPCVRTPMATSTCEGVSADDEHDEPLD